MEADIPVRTHIGETVIHVKVPAGIISRETRPVDMMDFRRFEDDEDEFMIPDLPGIYGILLMFAGRFDVPKLDEAQDVMCLSWEESNPVRRIILVHRALSIFPDCADTYVLLAEEEADTKARALEYYQQGVKARERGWGEELFEDNEGLFWSILETRTYMRARNGLAYLLWETGKHEESLSHYQDMIRLNPGDNQEIRYPLVNLLLGLGRYDETLEFLNEYEDDAGSDFLYTRALLKFRRGGATREANQALKEAVEMSPHIPTCLAGQKHVPNWEPDYIEWGGKSEASHYASRHLRHWRRAGPLTG